jgi:imidazolonepropionase-like amidohydrolase
MRAKFESAYNLMKKQESWCSEDKPLGAFPNDRSLDSLISLIRHEARLNNHCYQIQDFEMMFRLSDEFGFNITTFHHALEAWKIPDLIKKRDISVATFSDLWGYKYEAYDASVRGPKILYDAGVNTIIKTDHPVTFAKYLMWEAAKASHYGLPAQAAMASVTINPAMASGLCDRIGSIVEGKHADLVVWDRNPMLLGAKPNQVFIEGQLTFNAPTDLKHYESAEPIISKQK